MSLELHYFDFDRGGRGFPIRAALHHGKIVYSDVRFTFSEFQEKKKQGLYPTGLPILKLPSGKEITQSVAILRYVGKRCGLYPPDPETALLCDSIIDTVQDCMAKCPQDSDAGKKKAAREEYASTKMKAFCTNIESTMEGTWTAGEDFSIADLYLFFLTDMVLTGSFDYVPTTYFSENGFSKLLEMDAKVRRHPMITEYCASLGKDANL